MDQIVNLAMFTMDRTVTQSLNPALGSRFVYKHEGSESKLSPRRHIFSRRDVVVDAETKSTAEL